MLALFFVEKAVMYATGIVFIRLLTATGLMFLFLLLVFNAEKRELKGMPLIGKWIK